TVLMLVGLWSRASTAVSFVTAIALTSASFASSASWSHQYNVVFLAQLAFLKLLHGHFTLHWALSDNLRHQLLVRYDLAGLPRPAVADWIIDDVWRFR